MAVQNQPTRLLTVHSALDLTRFGLTCEHVLDRKVLAGTVGAMVAAKNAYTADSIQVLEGLDAVRKRPGMYIGSTDTAGLTHCLIEIVDNSADEASAGHASQVKVIIDTATLTTSVYDNGRGIPVDKNPATGLSGVELVLTKLHAGGKFDSESYGAAGGLHGVGAAVVNALSTTMTAEVTRDGAKWSQTFHYGKAVKNLVEVGKAPKNAHGTTITFTPDMELFTPGSTYDLDVIKTRLNHLTHLIPGLAATLDIDGQIFDYPATGGIVDLLQSLTEGEHNVTEPIHIHAEATFTERIPTITEEGTVMADVVRPVVIDVACAWTSAGAPTVVSYVNTIHTTEGGTHVVGFERGLTRVFPALIKTSDPTPSKDDICENLTAVVRVQLPEPQFSGQTKAVLASREVTGLVADAVANQLGGWLAARRNRAAAKVLIDLIVNNTRARLAAKDARDAKRKRTSLTRGQTLPAKLVDCRSRDVTRNELLIVEGDSALGTVKKARNSDIQAALPIRGKILNVARATEKQMLSNAECASIITVLGAGSGKAFDSSKLRYGRIVILADADVDGSHIRCLLLTLVYRYLRPMLDEGRIFAAVPPLHMVKFGSGKKVETHYTYSDEELGELLETLRTRGVTLKEDSIQRYKGLGEMDADQLAETTLDPQHRHVRRITIEDAAQAAKLFEVCMGADASIRKEYIISKAPELDPDHIDT